MTLMFVCWCDRHFGERDAFERHVVDCRDAPRTMRGRREEGSEAGRRNGTLSRPVTGEPVGTAPWGGPRWS